MNLIDCKRQHSNLGMGLITIRLPIWYAHSWILETLVLFQLSENTMKFAKWSMKYQNTPLTAGRELLAKVWTLKNVFFKKRASHHCCLLFLWCSTKEIDNRKFCIYFEAPTLYEWLEVVWGKWDGGK